MPFTQADIDALARAIADGRGARSITMTDGQTVTFNSIDDMLKLLAVMRQDVTTTAGGTRTRFAATSKGTS